MLNIADKADNTAGATGELTAAEYNNHKNEMQLSVTRSGLTLNDLITDQLAQAMFINGVAAQTVVDSGSANSVVLAPLTGASGLSVSSTYLGLNGAVIEFEKSTPNTTTAVTVNFGQSGSELGAKNLVRPDGSVCQPGDVSGLCRVQWDNSNDRWVLLSNGSGFFAENITATNTFIPELGMNHILIPDTGLGDLTQAVDDPVFLGQKVVVAPIDDGICYVRGTGTIDADGYKSGIYDGGANTGLYVTKNHKAELIGVEKGGVLVWQVTVEVTAEYDSGNYNIRHDSSGTMKQTFAAANTLTTNAGGQTTPTLPIAFASVDYYAYGTCQDGSTAVNAMADFTSGKSTGVASFLTEIFSSTIDYATFICEGKF